MSEQSLSERVSLLEKAVESLKSELQRALRKLFKAERRLGRRERNNEDLRAQVERLASKVDDVCQRKEEHIYMDSVTQPHGSAEGLEGAAASLAAPTCAEHTPTCCTNLQPCIDSAEAKTAQDTRLVALSQTPTLADDLRTAAEDALRQCGMVYDEASGYYYDHSTGLYYHAETQLYFDQKNGAYYYFDTATQTYVFHSNIKETKDTTMERSKVLKARKRKSAKQNIQDCRQLENQLDKAVESDDVEIQNCHQKCRSTDREDGELSDTDFESDEEEDFVASSKQLPSKDCAFRNESCFAVTSGWPPCIRAIVRKSQSMRPGSLHIITYPGGSVGQDKDAGHILVLPDVGVSKVHAEILYDEDEKGYFIQDLGSTNGTYVNEQKLIPREALVVGSQPLPPSSTSSSPMEAQPGCSTLSAGTTYGCSTHSQDASVAAGTATASSTVGPAITRPGSRHSLSRLRLSHRDVVRFATTCELLFHIHPSTDTCSECEPGVVLDRMGTPISSLPALDCSASSEGCNPESRSKASVEAKRRQLMKKIKQKYGLEKEAYQPPNCGKGASGYTDRAQIRRQVVGSDGIYEDSAVTVASSVDRAISPENKGHKLLTKMGWKSGKPLGRGVSDTHGGLVEPVKATIRLNAAAGLGANTNIHVSLDEGGHAKVLSTKAHISRKTRERFEQIK